MQLTAKLIEVLPVQTGEGRNGTWKKNTIIVETIDDRYPRKICVAIWGDKMKESDMKIGNVLDISFDIESREFNGKWYTDVKAWKVELANSSNIQQGSDQSAVSQYPSSEPIIHSSSADVVEPTIPASAPDDDLPF